MKKSIILTLALVFVLGIAGTAFAANPFVDVPAKHWAYDAVAKLAQAGIVDGYGDGTFKGDKTMTRYEMAQIVAKAMARSDKASAENKAAIDKLAVEFSTELNNMGVRVAKLEKKAAADSVNITGYARVKFENTSYDQAENSANTFRLRTRLFVTGQINDQWTYAGRLQSDNSMRSDDTAGSDQTVKLNNVWVSGPIAGTKATFGRFDYIPVYGMMMDKTMNGAKFEFGNTLKTTVYYGKQYLDNTTGLSELTSKNDVVGAIEFNYDATKDLTLKGAYYNLKAADEVNYADRNAWEVGFGYKLSQDWTFTGNYGRTNADEENKAWMAQLGYKGADKTKVNSFGAYLQYRNLQAASTLATTYDNPFASAYTNRTGGKGYEVGFSYVPMLNTVFTTYYSDIKATTAGSDAKSKYYAAKVEFWF